MKKMLWIFIPALLLVLVSCRHREVYSFLNPTEEIEKISIVQLSFDSDNQLIETELRKIEDITAFLEAFHAVDCYTWYGDPTGVTPEGEEATVIKILYKSGEYELINYNGQAEYTAERGLRYYAGFSVFDEQKFKSLIEDFLSD